MNIISQLQGLSFTLPELYTQISHQGWEIKKVKYDSGQDRFIATGKASHGEELNGWGPNERQAVANLLLNITHRNGLRSDRYASWSHTFTNQLSAIAEAYSKAPIYEPKAAIAFMELGRDAQARARTLGEHLEITVSNNPEPYANTAKMCEDIRKRRKLEVSQAGLEHPIWSNEQALAFRIAFDVLGCCASGGEWDWPGTNLAFTHYASLLPVEAQKALFTEVIGQTAYATYYRAYGPAKIALLPEFIEPVQKKENPHDGYRGTHPSQSYAPLPQPSVRPYKASGTDVQFVKVALDASGYMDPNEGWSSGIEPLPQGQNPVLDYGDPLQGQETQNTAGLINTEWAKLNQEDPQEVERMKLAILNAFKVVLLSPRKNLQWNAIHYQDIADMTSTDPTELWDRLESRRQAWNVERHGEDARYAHMPYYKQWKALEQLMYQKDPQAGWDTAIKTAKEFLYRTLSRIQEEVKEEDEHMPEEKQRHMYAIDNEANKRVTQFLKTYIKDHYQGFDVESRNTIQDVRKRLKPEDKYPELLNQDVQMKPQDKGYTDPSTESLFDVPEAQEMPDKSKYGAWMGNHLKSIAAISQHIDEILKAALWDVHERKGTGHHFRATVLGLQVPGVGPKVASFAWLLLQPLTSQLATIDVHMMEFLGHNYDKEMNPRDYFKFERELAAGRDASGYGHVPLGAFQWGAWDYKRSGPGLHQDHSAMKVLDPTPHEGIEWEDSSPVGKWTAPEWWALTQPARDQVGEDWDHMVSDSPKDFPANRIPYGSGTPLQTTSASYLTPWYRHPGTGERVPGKPGQTIMQHIQSMGLTLPEAWAIDEAGKL